MHPARDKWATGVLGRTTMGRGTEGPENGISRQKQTVRVTTLLQPLVITILRPLF